MSRFRIAGRPASIAVAGLVATLALAAVALAGVRIYGNDFSGKGDAGELKVAGKGCSKTWDRKHESLILGAERGPVRCRLKLPIRGDAPRPDHTLLATINALEPGGRSAMAKSDRKIYVALSIRDGAGGRYELRIYPDRRRYELRRHPEKGEFPLSGRDEAIGKLGERNTLRLEAIVDSIKGKVNKKRIGPILDPDAAEIEGTRMTIVLGMEGKTDDPLRARVDDIRVEVPRP